MHKKDLWLFAAVGILGQGMFSFCYYNAINMMSISTACILMYLSRCLSSIMAHFVFKDKLSRPHGVGRSFSASPGARACPASAAR